jgi:hypothetical protein
LLPERHSFPPRILIIILGTIFAFLLASASLIGAEMWRQNQSPEKQLATEIWADISADSKPKAVVHQFWSKLSGRNGSSSSSSSSKKSA